MEIGNYFKLLSKQKYTLIIIPLVAIILTFFLVRNQPDTYSSVSEIATGIVDQTQATINQQNDQESKINQEFANLIEMLRSKRMMYQVGYQLMINDLQGKNPYRKPSKLLLSLNPSARQHAIQVLSDLYNKRQLLSLFDRDQLGLYKLMVSMKYDDASLLKILTIYRNESSDFITVQCDSDNPQLSAFIINSLCSQFIEFYNSLIKDNQHKAVTFLGGLLKSKHDTLERRMNDLKQYKIQNNVFNLSEQARALYGEIANFEASMEQAKKDAVAYGAAIADIDKKFDPNDRKYVESAMTKVNQNIVNTRAQMESLNYKYVQSGFDPKIKTQIDSLQQVMSSQINQSSDKYITNPLNTKQALIQQKLTLQVSYDLAKNSIASIQSHVNELNARLHSLVPHEAVVQSDENAITVASQEYLDILQKYNQASLESNFTARLKQVEIAMPGLVQPSKKMLLVILSGIITFVFCLAIFFILFLLDNSIRNPRELANKTKTPVIGYLNLLENKAIDLNKIWNNKVTDSDVHMFKDLLQSIRFEVDNELLGNKVLLVNSISEGEGKTFFAMNLAYAYAMVNKRVLLVDGNFVNANITALVNPQLYLEDYFGTKLLNAEVEVEEHVAGMLENRGSSTSLMEVGKNQALVERKTAAIKQFFNVEESTKISVVGNHGGSRSLMELADNAVINDRISALKQLFDIIIIEAPALSLLNKSKEWTLFSEKIVTVFEAGQKFKDNQQVNLDYLRSTNGKFIGWVMNMVTKDQIINTSKVN